MNTTTAERRTEMQAGCWVAVKCPQAVSQRKISEIERDLKRFQLLLCFWGDPCQALRPGGRATMCIQYWKEKGLEVSHCSKSRNLNWHRRESNPSAEVPISWLCFWLAELQTQEHKESPQRTGLWCWVSLVIPGPHVTGLSWEGFLHSGTGKKQRAVQEPDATRARKCPLLLTQGLWAALKSSCRDWEKMATFCSKPWNKISSAAPFLLHFSTEPMAGSGGAAGFLLWALVLQYSVTSNWNSCLLG